MASTIPPASAFAASLGLSLPDGVSLYTPSVVDEAPASATLPPNADSSDNFAPKQGDSTLTYASALEDLLSGVGMGASTPKKGTLY